MDVTQRSRALGEAAARGLAKRKDFDHFLLLDDFRDNRKISPLDFSGMRIAALRQSPTYSPAQSSMATACVRKAK
jgi:hypothetical protein